MRNQDLKWEKSLTLFSIALSLYLREVNIPDPVIPANFIKMFANHGSNPF